MFTHYIGDAGVLCGVMVGVSVEEDSVRWGKMSHCRDCTVREMQVVSVTVEEEGVTWDGVR